MNLSNYLAGGRSLKSELARTLDVSPALVYQWANGIRPVAIQHCKAIHDWSKGQVTLMDLRPTDWQKIWPDLKRRATDKVTPP